MNQILSTSMPMDGNKKNNRPKKTKQYNRNGQPIQTKSILKFFAIAILVFGVFMIGTGAYAIYTNQSVAEEENAEPTISIENKTDTIVLLKVLHKKNIANVSYRWNNGEEKVINGNNGKYLEYEINVPAGINTLHVKVQDESGKETTYDKQYDIESNINIQVSGNKIKITYEGNTNVSYMTYRWDEEDEEKVNVDDTSFEQEIEALKGLHTLTVIVVDEDNNTDTKVQKIEGISKPKLEITYDEEVKHFVIITSDDEKLSKIEFKMNEDPQTYLLNLEDMNLKELEYKVQKEFETGENILEVTVYNSKGITEYQAVKFVKQ